ncbi:MAG: 3-dehydroquinate synthase [Crocinitomix sp.]|nr:3-dehydroquinate synthase [Crocinitomix sp.]
MDTLTYNQCEIRFGNLKDSGFNDLLASPRYAQSKKIIITDSNVFDLWMEDFITSFPAVSEAEIIQLPPGEENKVLDICQHVWEALSEYEIGRGDLIINFGGGVITDMGGFIAATFKRGLSFINIPTTLLSQVDASVGGKTGIDLGPFKNQIGVFADPDFVFIDSRYLTTLPDVELDSGFAEMLKHGLIADAEYWNDLQAINPKLIPAGLIKTIYRSVEIKRQIVTEDHLEKGLRKNLNFGHTIGHAIEGFCLSKDAAIPHGFAVAWGMLAESFISLQKGLIIQTMFDEINKTIRKRYTKLNLTENDLEEIKPLLLNDKKNVGGVISFTLLTEIGKAVHNQEVTAEQIDAGLCFILS